jgi:hypothetical protein
MTESSVDAALTATCAALAVLLVALVVLLLVIRRRLARDTYLTVVGVIRQDLARDELDGAVSPDAPAVVWLHGQLTLQQGHPGRLLDRIEVSEQANGVVTARLVRGYVAELLDAREDYLAAGRASGRSRIPLQRHAVDAGSQGGGSAHRADGIAPDETLDLRTADRTLAEPTPADRTLAEPTPADRTLAEPTLAEPTARGADVEDHFPPAWLNGRPADLEVARDDRDGGRDDDDEDGEPWAARLQHVRPRARRRDLRRLYHEHAGSDEASPAREGDRLTTGVPTPRDVDIADADRPVAQSW